MGFDFLGWGGLAGAAAGPLSPVGVGLGDYALQTHVFSLSSAVVDLAAGLQLQEIARRRFYCCCDWMIADVQPCHATRQSVRWPITKRAGHAYSTAKMQLMIMLLPLTCCPA